MNEIILKSAEDKLKKEAKEANLSSKAAAVSKAVLDALIVFIKQEEEFAQAIVDSEKKFEDVCKHCVKNCGSSISDLDVFKRAVEFYFPGAGVEFVMKINLSASVENKEDVMNISLTDLL